MTTRPAKGSRTANLVHLAVAQAGQPSLARHPDDGWRLAEPYPLGPRARAVLRAVIEALCPRGNAPRSPRLMADVELGARRFLRYMHPTVARTLWLGLFIIDWLPVLTFRSRGRLHQLGPERASAFVARWGRSRIKALRLLMLGLQGLVLSIYFDQADVHEAMGYRPIPFMRERVAVRRALSAAHLAAR